MTFRAVLKKVRPFESSIDPALLFEFEISQDKWTFATFGVEGSLFSEDKKFLSKLQEANDGGDKDLGELAGRGSTRDDEFNRSFTLQNVRMIATLSKKALDYVEQLRDKNSKHNVVFHLQLRAKWLVSNVLLANVNTLEPQSTGVRPAPISSVLLKYEPKRDWYAQYQNLWLLSGSGGPVFLKIQETGCEVEHTIASSEWVYDYAPTFELGRFLIVDIPCIAPLATKDILGKRMNAAIKAIQIMETKIRSGEWDEAVKEARPFMELVREKSLIANLLVKNGYTREGADAFYKGITELFNFSSKFIHKVEKGGVKLLPEIKAQKEDAYMVYSLSASLLNLIARKKVRASQE